MIIFPFAASAHQLIADIRKKDQFLMGDGAVQQHGNPMLLIHMIGPEYLFPIDQGGDQQRTAARMAAPILGGCGLCLFRNGDTAFHYGVNKGFLSFWKFSLKKDLCVAGMVNYYSGSAFQAMVHIQNEFFQEEACR